MTTAYSGDGITFPDNSVQNTAPKVGMVNRLINSDMRIDQRNAGATGTSVGVYTIDRWNFGSGVAGKMTYGQNRGSLTPPAGFTNYFGFITTTAHTVGAGEFFLFTQEIEGFNVADFDLGKATAQTFTLSFWVNSTLTGTFGGVLSNSAQNRSFPFTYTINAASTWEKKTVTVVGDTTGTWLTTNGKGLSLYFGLGVGSTYNGTATGAWQAATYLGATGATSVVGTLNATWNITGVQLEKGSTATAFDYRDYGRELSLCQRYYEKSFNTSIAPVQNAGSNLYEIACTAVLASTGQARFPVKFLVTKRTTPTTTTTYNPSAANAQARDLNAAADCTSTSITYASDNFMLISGTQPAGTSAGNRIAVNWSVESEL